MREPAAWLLDNVDLIRPGGLVLDVACGTGRHAVFLASRGYQVHAVDRDATALATLRATAAEGFDGREPERGRITTEQVDLEAGPVTLGTRRYDAVVVFNYLHRPLLPALVDAVADGGVLIYETFTRAQAERGRPRRPEFLLREGELPGLVTPLRVIRGREGDVDGRCIASIVAMR